MTIIAALILLSVPFSVPPKDALLFYCGNEVEYTKEILSPEHVLSPLGPSEVWSIREHVLPSVGPYRCYYDRKELKLSPAEDKAIESIIRAYSSPAFDTVYLHCSPESPDRNFVDAICFTFQEDDWRPWIPPGDEKPKFGLVDSLLQLSKLRHLELFCIGMTPDDITKLSMLENIEYLGLPWHTSVDHVAQLPSFKKLKSINLSGIGVITGDMVQYISKVSDLAVLDLRRNKFEKPDLAILKANQQLTTLLVSDTNCNDDLVQTIVPMPKLKTLTLHRTAVTDRVVPILESMTELRYVTLYGTEVSADGIRQLNQKRPNLTVVVEKPDDYRIFLRNRQYLAAYAGDIPAQQQILSQYGGGQKAADVMGPERYEKLLKEKIGKKEYWGGQPYDPVEYLKWLLICKARIPEAIQKSKIYMSPESLEPKISALQGKLTPSQILEAQTRALAYLALLPVMETYPDKLYSPLAPVYQYCFHDMGI
jgi:hypothetical protein